MGQVRFPLATLLRQSFPGSCCLDSEGNGPDRGGDLHGSSFERRRCQSHRDGKGCPTELEDGKKTRESLTEPSSILICAKQAQALRVRQCPLHYANLPRPVDEFPGLIAAIRRLKWRAAQVVPPPRYLSNGGDKHFSFWKSKLELALCIETRPKPERKCIHAGCRVPEGGAWFISGSWFGQPTSRAD